jgi:cytoskeletal protein RodZ
MNIEIFDIVYKSTGDMTIMKNPVFLAFLATCVVFAVSFYYHNYYDTLYKNPDKKKRDKNKKKKKGNEWKINETMVVSSAIAGIVTWFLMSYYFGTEEDVDKNTSSSLVGSESESGVVTRNKTNRQNKEQSKNLIDSGQKGGRRATSIPKLEDDDITRSYNLLGTGVSIPKNLTIPKVLVDYN